jgi:hypothetical protein
LNQDKSGKKQLKKSSIFEVELEKCKNVSLLISEDIYKKEQKAKEVYKKFLRQNNDSKYSWYSFVQNLFYKLKVDDVSLTESYQKLNKSYNSQNLNNNERLLSLLMRDSTQEFIYCFEAILNYFSWDTVIKMLFWGSNDCATVSWKLIGMPLSGWSMAYFIIMFLLNWYK